MKKIAVIIPTINRKNILKKCLDTLGKQTFKEFSIYVVNNASKDGTDIFLKKEFPQVHTLNFKQPLGIAGGYNRGLEQALKDKCDWFWLMDDDVWTQEDSLEKLVKFSGLDASRVYASVCMDEEMTGDLAWANDLLKNGSKKNARVYPDLGKESLVESNGIGYLGLFLPRKVIETVGFPDEKMFAWVDDVDFYLRIKEAGYRMYYVRESLIYHPKSNFEELNFGFKKVQTTRSDPWREYYAIRNSIYLWLKHGNHLKIWFFKIPKQFLLYTLILVFHRDRKLERFKYHVLGFYHGATGKMGLTVYPKY